MLALTVDAIIAGAGPAGAATAITLARGGRRVLLVDKPSRFPDHVGESLPSVASALLDDLGVWPPFTADGHQPCYGAQSAWGGPDLVTRDAIRDPYGPGWRLDRPRFDLMLRQAARTAGVTLLAGSLAAIDPMTDGWRVTVAHDGRMSACVAPWLVDATGRGSRVVRRLIHRGASDTRKVCETFRVLPMDRLLAFAAWFMPSATTDDDDTMTLVEGAPDGWWYTARLPQAGRVAVYHTDATDPTARAAATPDGYLALVEGTQHIAARLVGLGYRLRHGPRVVAAHSARLAPAVGAGWLAVGDAALAFDPLSAQGLLTALHSGYLAGRGLAAALDGDMAGLAAYQTSLDAVWNAYCVHYHAYYNQEQRWRDRPFWRRRHGAASSPLPL